MHEVFIVEAYNELNETTNVFGVYSTFDRAVEGADAYASWFQNISDMFYVTPTILDRNITKDCLRYKPFELKAGCVPKWYYRGSAYQERFTPQEEEKQNA